MGQRSQIYIRYDIKGENGDAMYSGLIARYFGWNYGERMVSRASGILEILDEQYKNSPSLFNDKAGLEKLVCACNTNFDMNDIMLSSDIIEEIEDFNFDMDTLFHSGNNDGQLLIKITGDGIKYAFIKSDDVLDGEYENPLTAEEYMEDEYGEDWDSPNKDKDDWGLDSEAISYTKDNIFRIGTRATLMTGEESIQFVEESTEYLKNYLATKKQMDSVSHLLKKKGYDCNADIRGDGILFYAVKDLPDGSYSRLSTIFPIPIKWIREPESKEDIPSFLMSELLRSVDRIRIQYSTSDCLMAESEDIRRTLLQEINRTVKEEDFLIVKNTMTGRFAVHDRKNGETLCSYEERSGAESHIKRMVEDNRLYRIAKTESREETLEKEGEER